MLFLISKVFENNILIKLNRGNKVKLIIEVRLNLWQHFAFGLTLRNKRLNLGQHFAFGLTLRNKR